MLSEDQAEKLRTKTVETLLAVRAAYLAGPTPNAMKHWEILQNRMRTAARTTATPEQWITSLCRGMQIQSLSSSTSSAVVDLVAYVAEQRCSRDWLRLVETESAYLMALTRLSAEKRKEARNATHQNPSGTENGS